MSNNTIAQKLQALVDARNLLMDNLEANGANITGTTFPSLAAAARNIAFGLLHYATNSGILNKGGEYYPSSFSITTDFLPSRFVINMPSVLAGSYTDTSEYKMIGRMTITGLTAGTETHDVELTTGTGTTTTINVQTVITQTNSGQYELTVNLPTTPTRCVFRGTFEWMACDSDFEGDE